MKKRTVASITITALVGLGVGAPSASAAMPIPTIDPCALTVCSTIHVSPHNATPYMRLLKDWAWGNKVRAVSLKTATDRYGFRSGKFFSQRRGTETDFYSDTEAVFVPHGGYLASFRKHYSNSKWMVMGNGGATGMFYRSGAGYPGVQLDSGRHMIQVVCPARETLPVCLKRYH